MRTIDRRPYRGRRAPATEAPYGVDIVLEHLFQVAPAVASLRRESSRLAQWGDELARRLLDGHRILAAGNGGSAAEVQHFTAELLGRYAGERRPFSAIALHGDSSAITAIGNDYGYDNVFARQVTGHIREGDILLLLTTSGRSPNLLEAAKAAREAGATSWALTGAAPNPLAAVVDDVICINAPSPNVQEAHLIALHALCECFDAAVERLAGKP
jgi:D-sedoheptulose 7-phosphate isomerase